MGCEGIRIEKPEELAPAMRRALDSNATTVIDVRSSLDETFRKVTSPLARPGG
jgi:thiamine pyrophosphate-dependent acetolactate synthase large subunit-like protein